MIKFAERKGQRGKRGRRKGLDVITKAKRKKGRKPSRKRE